MKDFIQLPPHEQLIRYEQASAKLNLPVPAIEKDFWVCWTLDKLFGFPEWREYLTFKGGTSLSKVWNLIQRFSEDIDLTVSRELLGFTDDTDPEKAKTPSQKKTRIKRLKKTSREKVLSDLLPRMQNMVADTLPSGTHDQVAFDENDTDNNTIVFHYPRVTPDESLGMMLPYVKIEMGPRGDNWPAAEHQIKPYIEEALPGTLVIGAGIGVRVLDAERTFLEKAMLLHEDIFRPADRSRKPRMSRHYYDLYCMIKAGVGQRAIADTRLFERVREHRRFSIALTGIEPGLLSRTEPPSLGVLTRTEPVHAHERL